MRISWSAHFDLICRGVEIAIDRWQHWADRARTGARSRMSSGLLRGKDQQESKRAREQEIRFS